MKTSYWGFAMLRLLRDLLFTILLFFYSILIGEDNTSDLFDYYHIEKEHTFSSKILNIKMANSTGEYVVVLKGLDNNSLEYYNSDHSLKWQIEIVETAK